MAKFPFLHTWSNQSTAKTIDLKDTFEFGYITKDDKEIYDLSSGSYHQSFGLKNSEISEALKDQLDSLPMAIPKNIFDLKLKVTTELINLIGQDGRIFYTVSGAESVENAIKMARQITKKEMILSCENSYHGGTLGSLSITGDWRRAGAGVKPNGHAFIPNCYNDPKLNKTKSIIAAIGANKIAAICLETVTGGNGVYAPTKEYMSGISKLCKEHGIKLIMDEVICGLGRCGENFAFQDFDLKPDFVCMAKNITAGYIPFGAVFVSEDNANFFDKNILSCGLTNAAHPLGLRALDSVLKLLESKELRTNMNTLKEILIDFKKNNIDKRFINDIRVYDLLLAIQIDDDKANDQLWNRLIDKGIFVNIARNNVILAPYFNFPTEKFKECLETIIKTLEVHYED